MSDNPNNKKLDGKRISKQSSEEAHHRRKNVRKKRAVLISAKIAGKDPSKNPRYLSNKRSAILIVDRKKLETILEKLENAAAQPRLQHSGLFDFCKEWEERGKPIFNMVLLLFSFSTNVQITIRRIMKGVDGVCGVPEAVVDL